MNPTSNSKAPHGAVAGTDVGVVTGLGWPATQDVPRETATGLGWAVPSNDGLPSHHVGERPAPS